MRSFSKLVLFAAVGGLGFGIAQARTNQTLPGTRMFQLRRHQFNNVDMPITNWGEFGMSEGHTAGTYFPKGSGEPYIFGAGVWIGAIHNGDTLVSCGYNTVGSGEDFCPGPPEHMEDHAADRTAHPEDRVYFSTDSTDLAEWPDEVRGVKTRDTLPPYDIITIGHEYGLCEYHDLLPSLHQWQSGTYPLGLRVRQQSFLWDDEYRRNIIFIMYEFENVSDETIRNMYVGHASDMDVGDADDDLVGCDIDLSLGYTYTVSQEANWISYPPYYVGVKFLQGPKADDTVYVAVGPDHPGYPDVAKDTIYPGERLPLTAFNKCTRARDADNEVKRYQMLAGHDIATGEYNPWVGVVDYVPEDKRMVMGCGPFELEPGEVDTFLIGVMFSNGNTGGLNYLKAQAIICQRLYEADWMFTEAPEYPRLRAIPGDGRVTLIWDNYSETVPDLFTGGGPLYRQWDFEGYRLWKSRTGRPDDWEVIGQWDLKNEIYLLPGDYWVPGFGNASGDSSNNSGLVYSYIDEDVINGVSYYYALTAYDYNVAVFVISDTTIWIALETGKKSVTVTPRSEPGNYQPPQILGISRTLGNTNAVDTIYAEIEGALVVTGHSYDLVWDRIWEGADKTPIYTYKLCDRTDDKPLFYGQAHSVPTTAEHPVNWMLVDSWLDTLITADTTTITDTALFYKDSTTHWGGDLSVPFDGMRVSGRVEVDQVRVADTVLIVKTITIAPDTLGKMDTTTVTDTTIIWTDTDTLFLLPDSVRVETGEYPGDLKVKKFYPSDLNKWAHHGGADIEIHWERYGAADSLSIRVYDAATGAEIPYDSAFGDNWCFSKVAPPKPQGYIAPPERHAWFYISGVQYQFNGGDPLDWATPPKPGDIWRIYSSCPTIPPTFGNTFTITTQAKEYVATSNLDSIKVVPNPYFVRADWDLSKDYRKVYFTHLPSECTIRIYTLAGDLVRVIKHSAGESGELGGQEPWDLLTKNDQWVASGIYIYHISTPGGQEKIGKLAIIR